MWKQSRLSDHSTGRAIRGTRQLKPVAVTGITVGQFCHHIMSTPRAVLTYRYRCLTHTHRHPQHLAAAAAAASSKENPHPHSHFPSDSSPVDRCMLPRGKLCQDLCVRVSGRPHVCQGFRVGGGTILTLSGVLAWLWPRLQVPGPVWSVPPRIDTADLGCDVLPLAARPPARPQAKSTLLVDFGTP